MKGDKISFVLCMLVAICMMGLLTYHIVKDPISAQPIPEHEFRLACVEDMQYDSIGGGYEILYYVDSLDSTIVVTTSLIEGDCLRVMLDYLDQYVFEQQFDRVNKLQEYADKHSKLKYIDNDLYRGFIWIFENNI